MLSLRVMQVKSIAECSNESILQYFRPSLSYHLSLRSLFLSIFEWQLKTGFTVRPIDSLKHLYRCMQRG